MLQTSTATPNPSPAPRPLRGKSIQTFSDDWGWSRDKTYRLINSGKLRAVQVVGQLRILAEDEATFIAALPPKAALVAGK